MTRGFVSKDSRAPVRFEMRKQDDKELAWLPDLIYTGRGFERGLALVSDSAGRIARIAKATEIRGNIVPLKGRAMLPGLVNAHSHAFQRVIRGRTEYRTGTKESDNFWTWREMMYSAAARLSPEDLYTASRMAFLEMAACGITSVGEFHYLHHAPEGKAYDDPNLLSKTVIAAARDVGLRICLLRVAYARSGFKTEPNPKQARFIERDSENFLANAERLRAEVEKEHAGRAWAGVAPHSIRAVPLDYLHDCFHYALEKELPLHMHIAEQPAEIEACLKEYDRTPVALLESEGLLHAGFTGVHGIHLTEEEAQALGRARSIVCACPTTERNLGDGIVPAELLFKENVRISLGTDSHTQIDLLEDARELEYHMRLQKLERVVLQGTSQGASALAARLFDCATLHGAESIKIPAGGGTLEPGRAADFFTVDLHHPTIAGASTEDLLAHVVFSLSQAAVRETVVSGRMIVESGQHRSQAEIIEKFIALQKRLWN